MNDKMITIGELAKRSGVAASALRFYEDAGLLHSTRTSGRQRQFSRDVLRRVGFIRVAQSIGLRLEEIRAALSTLPENRTPTKQDWERLSRSWRPLLQQRIDSLTALRDQLSSCIGCGCLSLQKCALYNPEDIAQTRGNGPRYLLGDNPAEAPAGRTIRIARDD
ncbi:redox-sensitive transcriptional activator SoxR [Collimonas sp. NPDC087041]|uniref:redox-sensitive transcriptional activator SoxR n=1 Tax=Collimonas sp. NPDC087041 TaxID=3363960 RepID=UPI003803032A